VYLRTGDPFGFFERERMVADDRAELLVYPRVIPLRRLALPLHHPSLDVVSAASPVTDPTRTATIREYRPDDPQRLIHWPSTARRGSLHVRVLEPATSLHVSLLLDVRGFSFGTRHDELFEQTLSALASMAVFLQNQGAPVSLLVNTSTPVIIPPGASVPHLQHVLESLARITAAAGPSTLPWALEHLPPGNTVILAASEVAPELERTVSRLEQDGFHVLVLVAVSDARKSPLRGPGTLTITPDCDLRAILEGAA
jgi:uncharacterized protein (DUF58 family)